MEAKFPTFVTTVFILGRSKGGKIGNGVPKGVPLLKDLYKGLYIAPRGTVCMPLHAYNFSSIGAQT